MIARLVGTLVDHEEQRGIIDVNGVGYEVFAPSRALADWSAQGAPVTVHVSTQVREDAITLFGFPTPLERQAFTVLLGVTGVGPKLALACLEALSVDELARAAEQDDLRTLTRIQGVGKKTAQRLALELKGKLPVSFSPTALARTPVTRKPADPLHLALARLDFGKSEIDRALAGLEQRGIGVEAPVEQRLRAAIQILSGN